MSQDPFPDLPAETRLWVMVLDRQLEAPECVQFAAGVQAILEGWRHKGQAYEAAWKLLDAQLLLVAEPLLATAPSGCAIDSMLKKTERIASEIGARLASDHEIVIRCEGKLELHFRTELPGLLAKGHIGPETLLVNRSLHNLGELRHGWLERPLVDTWIGRKYGLAAVLKLEKGEIS